MRFEVLDAFLFAFLFFARLTSRFAAYRCSGAATNTSALLFATRSSFLNRVHYLLKKCQHSQPNNMARSQRGK
jgi:hypothetical protein